MNIQPNLRFIGAFFLLAGGYFIYLLNKTLTEAQEHSQTSFQITSYAPFVIPFLVVYGIGYLALGERAIPILGYRGYRPSSLAKGLLAAVFIIGFLLDRWFLGRLHELGYSTN